MLKCQLYMKSQSIKAELFKIDWQFFLNNDEDDEGYSKVKTETEIC